MQSGAFSGNGNFAYPHCLAADALIVYESSVYAARLVTEVSSYSVSCCDER